MIFTFVVCNLLVSKRKEFQFGNGNGVLLICALWWLVLKYVQPGSLRQPGSNILIGPGNPACSTRLYTYSLSDRLIDCKQLQNWFLLVTESYHCWNTFVSIMQATKHQSPVLLIYVVNLLQWLLNYLSPKVEFDI